MSLYFDEKDPVLHTDYRDYRIYYHATRKVFLVDGIEDVNKEPIKFQSFSAAKSSIDNEYKSTKEIEVFFDPENCISYGAHTTLQHGVVFSQTVRKIHIKDDTGYIHGILRSGYSIPKFLKPTDSNIKTIATVKALSGQIKDVEKKIELNLNWLEYVEIN